MHKILKSTLHKQCSCPEGKQCSKCIQTKTLKPSKHRSRQNKLSQWYNRRRAWNDLKYKKEREAENERRLDLERKKRKGEIPQNVKRRTSELLPSVKTEKKVHIRRRSESAPPYLKSRPRIYMEEPRHLPVPLVLKHYTEKPTTVHLFDRQSRRKTRRKLDDNAPVIKQNFRWYKSQKTLNDVKTNNNEEQQIKTKSRTEKAYLERDFEVYDLIRQRSESLPPQKVQKKVHVKRRSTSAKPRSASRYVTVKRCNHSVSLGQRCANCFYRTCCRCYCYLTCILLIVFFVIFII